MRPCPRCGRGQRRALGRRLHVHQRTPPPPTPTLCAVAAPLAHDLSLCIPAVVRRLLAARALPRLFQPPGAQALAAQVSEGERCARCTACMRCAAAAKWAWHCCAGLWQIASGMSPSSGAQSTMQPRGPRSAASQSTGMRGRCTLRVAASPACVASTHQPALRCAGRRPSRPCWHSRSATRGGTQSTPPPVRGAATAGAVAYELLQRLLACCLLQSASRTSSTWSCCWTARW